MAISASPICSTPVCKYIANSAEGGRVNMPGRSQGAPACRMEMAAKGFKASHDPQIDGAVPASPRLAFVYGTLKRGFGNHWLMEELLEQDHAQFLGFAYTKQHFPLVCGPFQVPFLLPSSSPSGHHVRGELYKVDSTALCRLDELEGVGKGHYERCPVHVFLLPKSSDGQTKEDADMDMSYLELDTSSCCTLAGPLMSCRLVMDDQEGDGLQSEGDDSQVDNISLSSSLSSSSSFIEVLAEAYFACSSYGLRMADCAPHIPCYTEKEASTYVRRKDRPRDRTFLEHVHDWIEDKGSICS